MGLPRIEIRTNCLIYFTCERLVVLFQCIVIVAANEIESASAFWFSECNASFLSLRLGVLYADRRDLNNLCTYISISGGALFKTNGPIEHL